jgi:hypothetical protein
MDRDVSQQRPTDFPPPRLICFRYGGRQPHTLSHTPVTIFACFRIWL